MDWHSKGIRAFFCGFLSSALPPYAINGVPLEMPEWLDTVNVPYGGAVDLIIDFTDPVIQGMSVLVVAQIEPLPLFFTATRCAMRTRA
jgi:hypothetical protein